MKHPVTDPAHEARVFRVWQIVSASGGQMSIAEIARHLDMCRETVRDIVRKRGWTVRNARGDSIEDYNEARGMPEELEFQ